MKRSGNAVDQSAADRTQTTFEGADNDCIPPGAGLGARGAGLDVDAEAT